MMAVRNVRLLIMLGVCCLESGSSVAAQQAPPPTWERVVVRSSEPNERFRDCALPDLDGDGDLDLAIIRGATWEVDAELEAPEPPIETWINDGTGHFSVVSIHPFATDRWRAIAFDWADVDGDGDDDVVLWGGGLWSKQVHPMENRGTYFTYFDMMYPAWPALLNAGARWSGDPESPSLFVFGESGDFYVIDDPACGLAPSLLSTTDRECRSLLVNADEGIELLDHDSDGDLDVLMATHVGVHPRLLENSDGQLTDRWTWFFSDSVQALPDWEGFCHALGDLDGDGLDDLVIGHTGPLDYGETYPVPGDQPDLLFKRTTTGFQAEPVIIETPFFARTERCFVADFNLDGRQDILFIGVDNSASYLALNRGDWNFDLHSSSSHHLPYLAGDGAAIGDLNGDDRPDIFVLGYNDLVVYLNKPGVQDDIDSR